MWCAQCQSEVAAELSADGQVLKCSYCRSTLQEVFTPSLHPQTKAARELLERWSQRGEIELAAQESVPSAAANPSADPVPADPVPTALDVTPVQVPSAIEPITPLVELPIDEVSSESTEHSVDTPRSPAEPVGMPSSPSRPPHTRRTPSANPEARASRSEASSDTTETQRAWRIDDGHEGIPASRPNRRKAPRMARNQQQPAPPAPQLRSDRSHVEIPQPHFDTQVVEKHDPGRGESAWGQVLAYIGIGVLTVGTALVVWGYFGGVESYASTGWLVATSGQMLLLLGVVTLVSGGMQQTTHEVGQRIEYLNGRMYRIERSTNRILRGPHFNQKPANERRRAKAGMDEADSES